MQERNYHKATGQKRKRKGQKRNNKNRTKEEHKQDFAYHAKCLECSEDYPGETGRRLQGHVDEHAGDDSKSNFLWQS